MAKNIICQSLRQIWLLICWPTSLLNLNLPVNEVYIGTFFTIPQLTEIMKHQDCHSVYSSVFEYWLHIIQKNSNLYRPVSWDPYFRMPHDQYSIIHAYRIFRDTWLYFMQIKSINGFSSLTKHIIFYYSHWNSCKEDLIGL